MQVNPLTREVLVKIVYYGPGLGGKTTSLTRVQQSAPPETRGQLVSLATPVDRTLYFDFLPLRIAPVHDHHVRLQLFTVPGQVYFNATRKLVLTGTDGVVFVADSQRARQDANLESLEDLAANLKEQGRSPSELPLVLQYNKRDLPDVVPLEELDESLNPRGVQRFPSCATTGQGVIEALDVLVRAVLQDLERRGAFGEHREFAPIELGRADADMGEQIGRASERIRSAIGGALGAAPDTDPGSRPPAAGCAVEASPTSRVAAVGDLTAHPPRVEGSPEVRCEGGPSWVSMFPGARASVRDVERAFGAGRLRDALAGLDALALEILREVAAGAGLPSGAAPEMVALLLGLRGAQWLAFRRVVQDAREGRAVAVEDALGGLALLIDLRMRASRLGR